MTKKTLVLLRHAHRDRIPGEPNNGLSSKGWLQAADAANALAKKYALAIAEGQYTVLTSPLRRCQETAEVIAKSVGLEPKVNDLLKEYAPGEPIEELVARIKSFFTEWKRQKYMVLVACSHGDWIPEAIRLMADKDYDIRKGAFVEITIDDEGRLQCSKPRNPETD